MEKSIDAAITQLDDLAQMANLCRRKGDALRARKRQEDAERAYRTALTHLDGHLKAGAAVGFEPSVEADLLAVRGGLLRRVGSNLGGVEKLPSRSEDRT